MKTVIICQARMGSTRMPGKVMTTLGRDPLMAWTVKAAHMARMADEVVVATSNLKADNEIEAWCKKEGVACFRGSESNVLDRCYKAAKKHKATYVVRLTCDCPFVDASVIDQVILLRHRENVDYASNVDPASYPDGLDVECVTFSALEQAWLEVTSPVDKDCWPQFIARNRDRFPAANLRCPLPGLQNERWVCDTKDDFRFCQAVAEHLDEVGPPSYTDILCVLNKHPEIRDINAAWSRNERFYEGLATERLPPREFTRSQRIYDRAIKHIPFAAQTFSKSHIQFPLGRAPLYVSHGDGGYIFDVDGNRYVDMVSAILPVVLGYRDPDVDAAIRAQLDRGISFSLATSMEADLAELLRKHIPCADMAKFGKSGTDVTSAAIRLSRAYTGRDHIALGGYHGWADWSMAATDRHLGIPETVRALTHRFDYGNFDQIIDLARQHKLAAIIVEPDRDAGFLQWLRDFTNDQGIVLIFDEVITGFRYSLGGAQKLFHVTPDLATFGKAMANGMPISAIVGKRKFMRLMQPPNNIFYSGTMFGETLSIAAAIATIKKLERIDGTSRLWRTGSIMAEKARLAISTHNLKDMIKLKGLGPRMVVHFDGPDKDKIRTLFMIEMIQNGVLIINSHNVSCSHGQPEIDRVGMAWMQTCEAIRKAIDNNALDAAVGNSVVAAAPLRVTA